tara:strand:+ start:23 stop:262 length:240 start_codon:yes stop_codon:yes gene_type:complete
MKAGDLVRKVDSVCDERGGPWEEVVGDQVGTIVDVDDGCDEGGERWGPPSYLVMFSDRIESRHADELVEVTKEPNQEKK